MRNDVVEISYEAMSPELRALIAYDPNGALDLRLPLDEIGRAPGCRWCGGRWASGSSGWTTSSPPGEPGARVDNPDIGIPLGMGTETR